MAVEPSSSRLVRPGPLPGPVAASGRGAVDGPGRLPDNAAAEAFNSTLIVAYVHRHRFHTKAEPRMKIATWITDVHNTTRRHSTDNGLPPITFEHHLAGPYELVSRIVVPVTE
ncbi:integrase core domain-containing protein [Nonomuraea sp. CA-143628]|uniref:integrase core domain-containing protein n=1 Tax=Nonomuraea sp. CA-143628 TaxID=3239997 RepID=UPI003D90DD47